MGGGVNGQDTKMKDDGKHILSYDPSSVSSARRIVVPVVWGYGPGDEHLSWHGSKHGIWHSTGQLTRMLARHLNRYPSSHIAWHRHGHIPRHRSWWRWLHPWRLRIRIVHWMVVPMWRILISANDCSCLMSGWRVDPEPSTLRPIRWISRWHVGSRCWGMRGRRGSV